MPGETDAEREKRELTVIFGGQFPFFGGRGVAEVEPPGGTAATGHGIVKEMQCCQNSNNALADTPDFCYADCIKTGCKRGVLLMNCPHSCAIGTKKQAKPNSGILHSFVLSVGRPETFIRGCY